MAAIGLREIDLQVNAFYYSGANKVVHLQAFGLWLAAGIAAVTGTVVIAQVLVRQRTRAAHQLRIGSALGMINRQAVLGAGLNDGIGALIGACLGVAVSIALSPLAPFGLARKAEPEPGIRLDGVVALIGLAATVVVVVGIGSLCTFVVLRRNGMRSDAGAEASGRSRVGSMLNEPVLTRWGKTVRHG